ncbi:asparagine synthase (glutamine-hydrolyzing) [bacterium 1XD42-8]|nr:asparagine synthase (glutamine-hydrolyzing) [bacterium 1XD42-8]
MCGIACCYKKSGLIEKKTFERMVDIIEHRGPDDRGFFYEGNLALGHRRLSIIDLSSHGRQPYNYKEKYVLVFNGEIYNYLELRKELEERGYHFHTKTDTEVLIAMYDYYGDKCVNRLNGMWAFVLFDKQAKRLFCSRDRFGVKPFYYWDDQKQFLCASEIKQIIGETGNKIRANRQKLLEFLILGIQDDSEDTMFQGVKQLLGGHNLIFDLKTFQLSINKYYDLSNIKERKIEYEKACKKWKETFCNSVSLRMRSDVPVGYCLSGGLDSSAILCSIHELSKKKSSSGRQYSISSCFEDERYDEQKYIDEVAKKTGVKSYKVFPRQEELFDIVDKIIWHMDEPFGSTSIYAQWKVFEYAREKGLTVMLDGQGADEQLAGYTGFYIVLFTYYLRKFKWIHFIKEVNSYIQLRAGTESHIAKSQIIFSSIIHAFFPSKLKSVLLDMAAVKYGKLPFNSQILKKVLKNRRKYTVSNNRIYILESMRWGLPSLLHFEDRDSMAHSIESRVPFLDYELVEFTFSLPISYKIKNGMTKSILRDGLEGILPEKIRHRYSKLGFVTPEDQWVNNNYEFYRKQLFDACKNLEPLIESERVMRWFDENKKKILRGDFLTWRIICAGRWIKIFNVTL